MKFAVTERGSFKRCPRQAVLTSKNGEYLTPMFGPMHLSTGTLVHSAQQRWINDTLRPPEKRKTLSTHILDVAVTFQDRLRERYKKQVGVYPRDSELSATHEAIDFAIAMCANYELRYGQPLPEGYRLIGAEQGIEVPVESTRHTCMYCGGTRVDPKTSEACPNCDPPGSGTRVHYLTGHMDALIQHTRTGRFDVLERKTYNARPNEYVLRTTDQFIAYPWMVLKTGLTDRCELLYDGQWRRMSPPRGRTFDDMFLRVAIPRRRAEFEEFERFLPYELNRMAEVYTHPETAYTNRPWRGCGDCKMDPLCLAMTLKEDTSGLLATKYTQRTDDEDVQDEDISNGA